SRGRCRSCARTRGRMPWVFHPRIPTDELARAPEQAPRIEQRERPPGRIDHRAAGLQQRGDVVDLVDAQAAQDALGLDDERAVALAWRRTRRLAEQGGDIEHRQNRAVQIAHAADSRRSGGNRRHEPERDDLAHPAELDCITCCTDGEHDYVTQLGHESSIPCRPSPGRARKCWTPPEHAYTGDMRAWL